MTDRKASWRRFAIGLGAALTTCVPEPEPNDDSEQTCHWYDVERTARVSAEDCNSRLQDGVLPELACYELCLAPMLTTPQELPTLFQLEHRWLYCSDEIVAPDQGAEIQCAWQVGGELVCDQP